MPELPEVETIVNGLNPHIRGKVVSDVLLRYHQLRWPIPQELKSCLKNQSVIQVMRRAKYILIKFSIGTLIIHLGMSGRLCIVHYKTPLKKHDHVDIIFSDEQCLRYHDPRRFGAILWTVEPPEHHHLLKRLGMEPFSPEFTASYLHRCVNNRRAAIKVLLMDSHVVVGIGNIYAAEALFLAKINPNLPAGLLTLLDCQKLVDAIHVTLFSAIQQGGTTLKDFVNSEGAPGYFAQQLNVYGRGGQACVECSTPLQQLVLAQRSTVYCSFCQPDKFS